MKRGGVSGAVSRVMIFCGLCLAVFAVLTIATADREAKLTAMTAQNAADYYEADAIAVQAVAALWEGGTLPDGVEVTQKGDAVSFSIPIGESQALEVEVSLERGACRILRWQTVYTGEWEPEEFMDLWDGFPD